MPNKRMGHFDFLKLSGPFSQLTCPLTYGMTGTDGTPSEAADT